MLKVVVDTSVLIRYALSKGDSASEILFQIVESKEILLFTSQDLNNGILHKIEDERIQAYLTEPDKLYNLAELFFSHALEIEPKKIFTHSRDINDNFLLDLVFEAKADYLITFDKDLLILENIEDIPIVTPYQFLAREM